MSNEVKNGATAEAPIKRKGRGVTNETRAVNQLKFHEKDSSPQNGLFIGHLDSVEMNWAVGKEGTAFAGLKMPYLTFHFASNHANTVEQRHYYHSLFPIASNIDTIPGGNSEWQVNNLMRFIKHIIDTFYLKGRQMTEAEEEALTLPFCDFDDNNEYVFVEPEEVLQGYAFIFSNVISILEGKFNIKEGETPKCVYKDANGKPISIWMKLLRHKRSKKGWTNVMQNGELGFDPYIGAGLIEILKPNTPPAILRIDVSKESITPKDTKKEPTLGGQGVPGMMPGGAVMPGMMPNMASMDNSAFMDAADDTPF